MVTGATGSGKLEEINFSAVLNRFIGVHLTGNAI